MKFAHSLRRSELSSTTLTLTCTPTCQLLYAFRTSRSAPLNLRSRPSSPSSCEHQQTAALLFGKLNADERMHSITKRRASASERERESEFHHRHVCLTTMTVCGTNCWIVIVTTAAGFVVLFGVAVVIMCCCRRRQQQRAVNSSDKYHVPGASGAEGAEVMQTVSDVQTQQVVVTMLPPTAGITTSSPQH